MWIWDKIKQGLIEFYETAWSDNTWKGKLSVLVGIIFGVLIGTCAVHHELAEKGCSASVEWYNWLEYGFLGIMVIFVGLAIVGVILRLLLDIPDYMAKRKSTAEIRKSDKEFSRNYKQQRRERLGYRYIDPDNLDAIKFWTVLVISILIIVVSISIGAGYVWWSIFC